MNLGRDGLIEALEGARALNFPNVFDCEKGEPARYFDAVAGCPSSLKHAPAAAHIPNPAPVATSKAAAPIAAGSSAHAAQTPGEFAEEYATVVGDVPQFSVRPWSGTVRVTTPGWSPAPAGGFSEVLYSPGFTPLMQYVPASLVVPCPTTFPPESATVT
jgi:hypothetical protein